MDRDPATGLPPEMGVNRARSDEMIQQMLQHA